MDVYDGCIFVERWMATELMLAGNDLLLYALMHELSDRGNEWYEMDVEYLSSWLNCTVATVRRVLSTLAKMGLLDKRNYADELGHRHCEYKVVPRK